MLPGIPITKIRIILGMLGKKTTIEKRIGGIKTNSKMKL